MPGVTQPLLMPPDSPSRVGNRVRPVPHVLAVTADVAFYAAVLGAGTDARWRIDWARSLHRAVETCTVKAVPVVIYDTNLPGVDWQWALGCFGAIAHAPRVVLAAASIDEDLWCDVLNLHGYDVVERTASPESLRRMLSFAWLSL